MTQRWKERSGISGKGLGDLDQDKGVTFISSLPGSRGGKFGKAPRIEEMRTEPPPVEE